MFKFYFFLKIYQDIDFVGIFEISSFFTAQHGF